MTNNEWTEILKDEKNELKKGFVEDMFQSIVRLEKAVSMLEVPMGVYYENTDNPTEERIYKNFYEDAVKLSSELLKEAKKQAKDDTPQQVKDSQEFYRDLRNRG
jgi:hypothetical protein